MGKRAILTLNLALYGHFVAAADATPFATLNMNPFMVMYSSATPRAAALSSTGQITYDVGLTLANNSVKASDTGEEVILDGETYFLPLSVSYGYSERWELSATLPLIHHSEGYLDNFIEQWHRVFGLTNARRDEFPSNDLNYNYTANGVPYYAMTNNQGGIGDLTLGSKYALLKDDARMRHVAFALDLKVPTGDPDKLTGSGAVDAALSLHASDAGMLADMNATLFAGVGAVALGHGDVLPHMQENFSYSAYFGGGWQPWSTLTLKLQFNYSSAVYDSNLKQLGTDPIQLYFGGSYLTRTGTRFDLAIGENLYTDPTPDFLVHFAVKFQHMSKH